MAATVRNVDLSAVKEGGNFRPRRKPEGDYRAKIVKVDDHLKEGKMPGWVYTIQIDGDARSTYPYYVNPEAKQAWKIRAICVAVGINVKLARVKFDPNKLVNKALGVALEDDEYEGRMKSTIADVFTVDEVGPNADEDAPVDDIDTDDEYDETSDVEGYDEDAEPEDDEPEPEPDPVKPARRRKPAPAPEPEDDDEDEEPPAPAPRRRVAKKPAPKPAPVVEDDDDDDLDDLDTDDLDD